MPYDPAQHFIGEPDGTGGVRLRFRDDLGTRDDSTFLPGSRRARDGEQEELDQQQPEIIGRLPDPGEQFHYSLEPDPDGDGWIVCLVSGRTLTRRTVNRPTSVIGAGFTSSISPTATRHLKR
jgi:hypothetical protein